MPDIIIPTPLNPTALTGVTSTGTLANVRVTVDGAIVTSGGGGGATADRELVVTTFRAINTATGVSIGDLITQTQILDVTDTPSTVSVLWRNQTTSADIAAPGFANLELTGGGAGNPNINPSTSFTRPADTTAYAAGDTVANSTTAGSVTPMTLTAARTPAGSFVVHRLKLHKSGTSITNAAFRAHMFKAAPTSASGDNAAISMTGVANYLGYVDIVVDQAFTDGAAGFSSLAMSDIIVALSSGQSLYALLEARAAYTPISAEVFTLTAEVTQD